MLDKGTYTFETIARAFNPNRFFLRLGLDGMIISKTGTIFAILYLLRFIFAKNDQSFG